MICLRIIKVNVIQVGEIETSITFIYLRVIFIVFISSTGTTKKASTQKQNLMYSHSWKSWRLPLSKYPVTQVFHCPQTQIQKSDSRTRHSHNSYANSKKKAHQPQYQALRNTVPRQVHSEPGSHQVRFQNQSTKQASFFTEAKAQYSS